MDRQQEDIAIEIINEIMDKERTRSKIPLKELIKQQPVVSPEIRGYLAEAIELTLIKFALQKGDEGDEK